MKSTALYPRLVVSLSQENYTLANYCLLTIANYYEMYKSLFCC